MALRLRDRQNSPWMQPGKRLFAMSSVAMKWTGLLLTCLTSLSVAVLQRALLQIDSYSSLEELSAAVVDASGNMVDLASAAVTCSMIASMALPLYAKLVYEGWKRMENRQPLLLRLGLCALISEIPYDFTMSGKVLDLELQNPAWGLFLCAAMLEVLQLKKPRSRAASALLQAGIIAAALAWALLLRVYLGTALVLLVTLFYFLEGNRSLSTLGGVLFTIPQFPAPFGMIFVHWYEPDEAKDAKFPNLFYLLYPAQLLVFGLIGLALRH